MKDTPDNEMDDVQNILTCWAVEEQYFNGINPFQSNISSTCILPPALIYFGQERG
jgi:hypothetical protein